jgi:hypothetical protein
LHARQFAQSPRGVSHDVWEMHRRARSGRDYAAFIAACGRSGETKGAARAGAVGDANNRGQASNLRRANSSLAGWRRAVEVLDVFRARVNSSAGERPPARNSSTQAPLRACGSPARNCMRAAGLEPALLAHPPTAETHRPRRAQRPAPPIATPARSPPPPPSRLGGPTVPTDSDARARLVV